MCAYQEYRNRSVQRGDAIAIAGETHVVRFLERGVLEFSRMTLCVHLTPPEHYPQILKHSSSEVCFKRLRPKVKLRY